MLAVCLKTKTISQVARALMVVLFMATCMLVPTRDAHALTIEYDTSFSTDGKDLISSSNASTEFDEAYDAILDTNGNYVVIGTQVPSGGSRTDCIIRRYLPNGTLDSTFGISGTFRYNFSADNLSLYCNSIALQDDGNILGAGRVYKNSSAPSGFDSDALVFRLTANGLLDSSFGSGGYQLFDGLSGTALTNDYFQDVTVTSSNEIVVAGGDGIFGILALLQTTGTLDVSFGVNGIAMTQASLGTGEDSYQEVIVDASGRLVVTGKATTTSPSDTDLAVWRFSENGVLDLGFAGDGSFTFDGDAVAGGSDSGKRVRIDGSEILVAGTIQDGLAGKGVLLKLNSSGVLANDFGTAGIVRLPDASWSEALEIFGGKYYVAGSYNADTGSLGSDSALWRFTSAGDADTNFGVNGMLVLTDFTPYAESWDTIYSLSVRNGEIFMTGSPLEEGGAYAQAWAVGKLRFGNTISNVPSGTTITTVDGQPITTPLVGTQTIRLKQSASNLPVVEFSANFDTGSLNLSTVVIDASVTDGKAVVHGLSGVHTLYVPKRAGDSIVIICPNAQTLSQVAVGCSGQLTFTSADSNVSIVTINGQEFWRVEGLTGTGGVSLARQTINNTATAPSGTLVQTGTSNILFGSIVAGFLFLVVSIAWVVSRTAHRAL